MRHNKIRVIAEHAALSQCSAPLEGKMRIFGSGLLILSALALNAYATPFLASAGNFAVLGATPDVTNTGSTKLTGLLGVSPALSITGAGSITVNGTDASVIGNPNVHLGDSVATTAQTDAGIGYGILAGLSPSSTTAGVVELGGNTFTPGVYNVGAALVDGVVTLNFEGLSNQNIVFQIGSTLTTASGPASGPGDASVVIEGANSTDNVFWQVGSSAQIGTYTSFVGNIIAYDTVAMQTGATDACGSVISLTHEVTLDTNIISNTCGNGTGSGGTGTGIGGGTGGGPGVPVPEGGSTLLYLSFFLLPIGALQAFRGRRSEIV
jgi:hypothetical protein